jgi:hypothetical protein
MIQSIEPQPGTGYQDLRKISVQWTERLNGETVQAFIYPPMEHDISVSGSRMDIELASPVGEEPVVIHLPEEISDRRGNQWGRSMDLVYTSSDTLPTGRIQVVLSRQGGSSLSSETLVEIYAGSTLVRRTDADSTGNAVIDWLYPAEYRLRCYEDLDRSYQWNNESEAGLDTTLDLAAGDTLTVQGTMTVVDTVGPILNDVSAIDAYHAMVTFNEEVSVESFGRGTVEIRDSLGQGIEVRGFWLTGGTASSSVELSTGRLSDSRLEILISGIADLMENPCRPDSMEFYGTDTLPSDSFRIRSFYPAPGSNNADPGGPYLISFNYFVDRLQLQDKLHLERVADSTAVQGSIRVVDGRSFEYYPLHQLIGEQQYRFLLEPGLTTLWGDTLDTPFSWSFSTLWGDEPGSISGMISGVGSSEVLLQIRRTGGDTQAQATYATVSGGQFQVNDIPAGRYTVASFIDTDGDGEWNGMEPYGTYPGVVLVQPGLMTRDVNIEILP